MIKTVLAASAIAVLFAEAALAAIPSNSQVTATSVEASDVELQAKRKKKRVPGGSGCDSAHDRAEHAGCSG